MFIIHQPLVINSFDDDQSLEWNRLNYLMMILIDQLWMVSNWKGKEHYNGPIISLPSFPASMWGVLQACGELIIFCKWTKLKRGHKSVRKHADEKFKTLPYIINLLSVGQRSLGNFGVWCRYMVVMIGKFW